MTFLEFVREASINEIGLTRQVAFNTGQWILYLEERERRTEHRKHFYQKLGFVEGIKKAYSDKEQ